ncbi:MAG TPA: flagellar basal body rod protein FlgC [Gammaproteobacteria bacterium]|nr:flagellar basal body rod protein FlgC [Gammaproteobacteria bacterium]
MSFFNSMNISASAMSAQMIRLNTVSSNLANAETASSDEAGAYRSKHPVFETILSKEKGFPTPGMVRVRNIEESSAPPRQVYSPGHPMANDAGYLYLPNVNSIQEMADMISASRAYQNNIEIMQTSRQLMLRTMQIGR